VHEAAEDAGLNLITGKTYPCAVLLCSALCCPIISALSALRTLRYVAQLHVHAKTTESAALRQEVIERRCGTSASTSLLP